MHGDTSRLEFVGELAGGLAHEIKNPLSTMQLHLELMEEELAGDSPSASDPVRRNERMRSKVQLLLREVRRLNDIVHEFLRVSRGHDLKLAAVEMAESLSSLVEFVRPEAERAGVSIDLVVKNQLGTALIDEDYLRQALLNLVQNAIHACEPKGGGRVIIEAAKRHGALGIAVIDDGVGIPEDQRDRIFRAWFTSRKGGTGMGLPIAKRVVEEHGGFLTFDSVPGSGSRFVVMLPAGIGDGLSQMMLHPEVTGSGSRTPTASGDPIDVAAVVNRVMAPDKGQG